MLDLLMEMPVIFIIASDWKLRASVRAELRERGFNAMGMESADEVGRSIAAGESPAAVVLEANPQLASDPVKQLVARVPTILIASRTETMDVPAVSEVLYRPVRIGEIVQHVQKLLSQPRFA